MSIPKIIHYCWFGGKPKSQEIKKCIESWSQLLNEYEIIEWNESNYRSDSFFYNYCIDKKKLAFATHYTGDIRSIYLQFFDTFLLKSRNAFEYLGNSKFIITQEKFELENGF